MVHPRVRGRGASLDDLVADGGVADGGVATGALTFGTGAPSVGGDTIGACGGESLDAAVGGDTFGAGGAGSLGVADGGVTFGACVIFGAVGGEGEESEEELGDPPGGVNMVDDPDAVRVRLDAPRPNDGGVANAPDLSLVVESRGPFVAAVVVTGAAAAGWERDLSRVRGPATSAFAVVSDLLGACAATSGLLAA